MSEKREFPILNGKLLSDLDLNGHHLIGTDSIIEIVAPSAEGPGKAADAKAVYEELEKKQDTLSDTQTAAVNSGITAKKVEKLDGVEAGAQKNPDLSGYAKTAEVPAAIAGKEIKPSKVSTTSDGRYVASSADNPFYVQSTKNNTNIMADLSVSESDVDVCLSIFAAAFGGAITTADYSGRKIFLGYNDREKDENRRFTLSVENGTVIYSGPEGESENTIANMVNAMPRYRFVDAAIVDGVLTIAPYTNAKIASDGTAFTVAVGEGSGYARDCVLVIDCGETTPSVIFDATVFFPRGGDAANLEVVAGKRNVFFITEVQPNQFMVARDELALPDAGGGE